MECTVSYRFERGSKTLRSNLTLRLRKEGLGEAVGRSVAQDRGAWYSDRACCLLSKDLKRKMQIRMGSAQYTGCWDMYQLTSISSQASMVSTNLGTPVTAHSNECAYEWFLSEDKSKIHNFSNNSQIILSRITTLGPCKVEWYSPNSSLRICR